MIDALKLNGPILVGSAALNFRDHTLAENPRFRPSSDKPFLRHLFFVGQRQYDPSSAHGEDGRKVADISFRIEKHDRDAATTQRMCDCRKFDGRTGHNPQLRSPSIAVSSEASSLDDSRRSSQSSVEYHQLP